MAEVVELFTKSEVTKRKPVRVNKRFMEKRARQVKEFLDDQKIMREIAPVALVDSARLERVVSGLAETFDLTIRDLFTQVEMMEKKDAGELTKLIERADTRVHNVLDSLNSIVSFLEELKTNAELEREALTKLVDYLNKTGE